MSEVISSLKVMQRMERLATSLYQQQIRGFKGETADKLVKACENEREHAQTLAKTIRGQNGSPSVAGFLFALAGGTAGIITLLIGKKTLLSIDKYIERKAVEDYTKFLEKIPFDQETAALLKRITNDEKRHIENWNASIEALQK